MLFLSFSDYIFSLWYLRQLFKSKNDHLANIFPHIFSSRQISGVTVTFMYWRRYDFSSLRQCCAIVVLLPMAVILCFVLQKWWRALFFRVGAKVRGFWKILHFWRSWVPVWLLYYGYVGISRVESALSDSYRGGTNKIFFYFKRYTPDSNSARREQHFKHIKRVWYPCGCLDATIGRFLDRVTLQIARTVLMQA